MVGEPGHCAPFLHVNAVAQKNIPQRALLVFPVFNHLELFIKLHDAALRFTFGCPVYA